MTTILGRAPASVHLRLCKDSPRFPLEGLLLTLRQDMDHVFLEAGEESKEFEWQRYELQLLWMWPAKGGGFCELSLLNWATGHLDDSLLDGNYETLEWMRGTGQHIARALGIEMTELDLGADC